MRSHAVIFDLGGVVLSWDPHAAYERVLPAEEVATFLERVDFAGWNRLNDGGRSFEEAEQELIARSRMTGRPSSATASTSTRR
jgi:2-haloacid dehalogenase